MKKDDSGRFNNRTTKQSDIFGQIGYFLCASNDEKDSPKYDPTPLQDIDPKELA